MCGGAHSESMLKKRLHPKDCLRCLRISWGLMALVILLAVLALLGRVDFRVASAAVAVLGSAAMAFSCLAAQHSGEPTSKEELALIESFKEAHHSK